MAGSESFVKLVITNKDNIKFFIKTLRLMTNYDDHLSFIFKENVMIILAYKDMLAMSNRFTSDFFDIYEVPSLFLTSVQSKMYF